MSEYVPDLACVVGRWKFLVVFATAVPTIIDLEMLGGENLSISTLKYTYY